jgi:DNA repair exonuclease SbcCD nuclease subunit
VWNTFRGRIFEDIHGEFKMRIAAIGDLHLTNKNPINRIDDDYLKNGLDKLKFCLDTAKDQGCDVVLQAGDFFENPYVSNKVMADTIRVIGESKIHCVYGQHDIIGHSAFSLDTAPYSILSSCGCVHLLSESPVEFDNDDSNIYIYGASFGVEIPTVKTRGINILVMHKNVGVNTISEKIQTEHPKYFAEKVGQFNYVLVGDFHYGFVYNKDLCEILNSKMKRNYDLSSNGPHIFNMGCMLRRNKTDIKQQLVPSMGILDTESKTLQVINVPVKSASKIFNIESFEESQAEEDYSKVTQEIFETMEGDFQDMDISGVFWNAAQRAGVRKEVIDKLNIMVENIGGLTNG